jgi:hypothetical protein
VAALTRLQQTSVASKTVIIRIMPPNSTNGWILPELVGVVKGISVRFHNLAFC